MAQRQEAALSAAGQNEAAIAVVIEKLTELIEDIDRGGGGVRAPVVPAPERGPTPGAAAAAPTKVLLRFPIRLGDVLVRSPEELVAALTRWNDKVAITPPPPPPEGGATECDLCGCSRRHCWPHAAAPPCAHRSDRRHQAAPPCDDAVAYRCRGCGFHARNHDAMLRHLAGVHRNNGTTYNVEASPRDAERLHAEAPSGGRVRNVRQTADVTDMTHAGGDTYVCECCEFVAADIAGLARHRKCHEEGGPPLSSSSAKTPAMKTSADGGASYRCSLCGYTCRQQRTIKAHVWKHSGHESVAYPTFESGAEAAAGGRGQGDGGDAGLVTCCDVTATEDGDEGQAEETGGVVVVATTAKEEDGVSNGVRRGGAVGWRRTYVLKTGRDCGEESDGDGEVRGGCGGAVRTIVVPPGGSLAEVGPATADDDRAVSVRSTREVAMAIAAADATGKTCLWETPVSADGVAGETGAHIVIEMVAEEEEEEEERATDGDGGETAAARCCHGGVKRRSESESGPLRKLGRANDGRHSKGRVVDGGRKEEAMENASRALEIATATLLALSPRRPVASRPAGGICRSLLAVIEQLCGGRDDSDDETAVATAAVVPPSYPCRMCCATFARRCDVRAHVRAHCEDAYRQLTAAGSGGGHSAQHQSLACVQCDFIATSVRSLKSHGKRHANAPLEVHACELCDYVCHLRASLKSHMWRHAADAAYCYERTNRNIDATALSVDADDARDGADDARADRHVCHLCGYACRHTAALKSHMWRHASDENYSYHQVEPRVPSSRDGSAPTSATPDCFNEVTIITSSAKVD